MTFCELRAARIRIIFGLSMRLHDHYIVGKVVSVDVSVSGLLLLFHHVIIGTNFKKLKDDLCMAHLTCLEPHYQLSASTNFDVTPMSYW